MTLNIIDAKKVVNRKQKVRLKDDEEEAGINITWGGILSFIHSSFTEYFVYTSVVAKISNWRENIDQQPQQMLMEVHCPFVCQDHSSTCCSHPVTKLNRISRQCHYWGIHDFGVFGPRSPWQPFWTSFEVHNNLRCFQPIFLPSLSFTRGQMCILIWRLSQPPGSFFIFSPRDCP